MEEKEEEGEWEEKYVVVQLKGVYEPDTLKEQVRQGETKVVRMETEEPGIVVGKNLYVGKWKETFGTDLIFAENPQNKSITFLGSSDRRVVAEKATILSNDQTKVKP